MQPELDGLFFNDIKNTQHAMHRYNIYENVCFTSCYHALNFDLVLSRSLFLNTAPKPEIQLTGIIAGSQLKSVCYSPIWAFTAI